MARGLAKGESGSHFQPVESDFRELCSQEEQMAAPGAWHPVATKAGKGQLASEGGTRFLTCGTTPSISPKREERRQLLEPLGSLFLTTGPVTPAWFTPLPGPSPPASSCLHLRFAAGFTPCPSPRTASFPFVCASELVTSTALCIPV